MRHKDYLLSHGLDGHRTVRQLWRDIQEQGFTGSLSIVAEFMAATHHLTPVSIQHTDTPVQGTSKSEKLTPRQATWLTLSAPDKLTDDQRQKAQRVAQLNPEVAYTVSEAQSFAAMLRQQTVDLFDSWLQRTRLSTIRELRTFARGIGRDYDAVKAALVLPGTMASSRAM